MESWSERRGFTWNMPTVADRCTGSELVAVSGDVVSLSGDRLAASAFEVVFHVEHR